MEQLIEISGFSLTRGKFIVLNKAGKKHFFLASNLRPFFYTQIYDSRSLSLFQTKELNDI